MKKIISLIFILILASCNSDSPISTSGTNGTGGSGDTGGKGNTPGGVGTVITDPADPNFDKDLALVGSLTQKVVGPKVQLFIDKASVLVTSSEQACTTNSVKVNRLQEEWKRAMLEFHYLDAVAFGPLAEDSGALRNHIYSWPDRVGGAIVDNQITKLNSKPDSYKFKESRMAGKGLDAFEYILFEKLAVEESLDKDSEVCAYVLLMSNDLKKRTQELSEKWKAELDYIASPDGQTSLDKYIAEMTDSLYFADKVLKDRKIAAGLGITTSLGLTCTQGSDCQNYLEHQSSKITKEAILANFQALSDVMLGYSQTEQVDGFGYVEYLKALDATEEDISFGAEVGQKVLLWEKLPSGNDFFAAVQNYNNSDCGTDSLCNAYKQLQGFTAWMKKEFITTLNTGLPGNVQGDND